MELLGGVAVLLVFALVLAAGAIAYTIVSLREEARTRKVREENDKVLRAAFRYAFQRDLDDWAKEAREEGAEKP